MGSLGAEVAKKAMWLYPKIVGFNPSERWGHSACYSNGLIYVFGGCCGGLHFSDVQVLNLETMAWSALVTKGCGPGPRDSHSALLWGNKMVIFGGTNGWKKVNDLHILDLGSNEWIRPICKGEPPSPRESHTATLIGDGELVIFGGSGEGVGNYLNDLHFLDLKTMTWAIPSVKGDYIPSPRDSHVCVSVGKNLFLLGGDSGDRYHGDVDRLDLHMLMWSKLATEGCSPGARAGHAAVGVGSKIYVIGGVGDKKYYNDAWSLDTETSSWSKLEFCSEVPQGRFSHTAVVADSDIVIYGGCGEDERPLRELLILQLGAQHPYGRYNISLCKNFGNQWQHQGGKRIHLGEEKSLKTMLLGIEIEAEERETHELHTKRRRTITNSNTWEMESEPEEHSHSLSISQHSSPSQSDQEQTTAKTKTPTSLSPSRTFPFLNQPNNQSPRNSLLNTINNCPSQKPQSQHARRLDISLPTTEERRGQDGRVQSLIGAEVHGKVDGAFDAGYLMTAMVNGTVFRGVLFSPVPNVVHRRAALEQSLSIRQSPAAPPSAYSQRGPTSGLLKPLNAMQPLVSSRLDSNNGLDGARMTQPSSLRREIPSMDRDTRQVKSDLQGVVLTLGGRGEDRG